MASFKNLATLAVLFAPAVLAIGSACSSSGNPSPTTVYPSGGDGGDATVVPEDSGATPDQGTPPADGGQDVKADAPGGDSSACSAVKTDAGCYVCPGTTAQFLNQCSAVGVQCSAFDNASRLPNYDGGLPPLN